MTTTTTTPAATGRATMASASIGWRWALSGLAFPPAGLLAIAVAGPVENVSWKLEIRPVHASGRFFPVHFYNNPYDPVPRFAIYDIHVIGGAIRYGRGSGHPINPAH